jgi:TRAP-type uncharacterized transport system fused permease subunit
MTVRGAVEFVAACGRALAELAAILLGIGFLLGAFAMTGLAGTLANDLVFIAGGAPLLLLVMGAITSFIFGMGMTVTACYIFLAIVLAPPLTKAGLDPLGVHLFIMYWGMVSFITPPVALANFAAASIAGTSAFKIGWQSMRLGTALYVVPFCFVLNPALLLKGSTATVIVAIASAFVGLMLVAAALQGHIVGIGTSGRSAAAWLGRALVLAGGLGLAIPVERFTGLSPSRSILAGLALALAGLALLYWEKGRTAATHGRTP